MFRVEEVRENNRAGLFISSFAAHIAAMALVLSNYSSQRRQTRRT